MKDKTFFKAPAHFAAITPLLICIMLLTSCARIDAYIHRNDPVEKPVLPVKVKVTYDGNGYTGGTVPVDGNIYDPLTRVTILADTGKLTLLGHTFAGWNTMADGSGAGYEPSRNIPISFIAGDKDVTLYAVWSKDIYIKSGETYTGAINGHSVHIENGGLWDMNGESTLICLDLADISISRNKVITGAIKSNGYNIYIDEKRDENSLFGIRTYGLPGGGMLMPGFPADVEASVSAVYYLDGENAEISNEEIIIQASYANKSAVYVKNGGLATLKHANITTSSFKSTPDSLQDASTRWGINSALYSCFAGTLSADDVKITTRGGDSAGASALYLGYLKLTDSSILCDTTNRNSPGVQVTYGGRMDLESVSIETWLDNSSILTTGAGGGTITAKNITGVAHSVNSSGIYVDGYGEIQVEGSTLKSENDSVVALCTGGTTIVKDSILTSGKVAVRISPYGQNRWSPGSGTFKNTRIISGSDAFYYNGMSADIMVQDGTTVEFPQDCKLIKADSIKGIVPGSEEKPEPVNGTFTAKNVTLNGDIELAEDGTRLALFLIGGTSYKGAVFGASVSIDGTSQWTVTETCIIAGIDAESASRINCPKGLRVYYDGGIKYLGTIILTGGGELAPIQDS
jgi:uncharacterized repeat protein (TIGR02543 family)